jgi:hypothetical protein
MQQFARFTRNADGSGGIRVADYPDVFPSRDLDSRDFVVTSEHGVGADDLARDVTWKGDMVIVDEDAPFILKSTHEQQDGRAPRGVRRCWMPGFSPVNGP